VIEPARAVREAGFDGDVVVEQGLASGRSNRARCSPTGARRATGSLRRFSWRCAAFRHEMAQLRHPSPNS
jgi:hypothetical protein